jgi:uncharacterized protein GlcG (DUF336 family)
MPDLTLASAQQIVSAALAHARTKNFKPLAVAVLDARGALKAYAAEDKTSLRRFDIARGKAYGAIAMGIGSRTLGKMAAERPHFVAAVGNAIGGTLIPVAGGVLIKTADGELVGAVGISGDTSDNDEAAATAGIVATGFRADPGSD